MKGGAHDITGTEIWYKDGTDQVHEKDAACILFGWEHIGLDPWGQYTACDCARTQGIIPWVGCASARISFINLIFVPLKKIIYILIYL